MSTYRIDSGSVLFVRVRTRSGAEGWGEAAASSMMAGETLTGMMATVRELIEPHLVGRNVLERTLIASELKRAFYANGGARCAVDMAMIDVAGKVLDVPASTVLGGAVRNSVEPLCLIGGCASIEDNVEAALELFREGFRAFKLKVGLMAVEEEIRCVRMLRQELGLDCLIGADANMGWELSTAQIFCRSLEDVNLAFLEQPFFPGEFARMRLLASSTSIPISADEGVHSVPDIISLQRLGAIRGVSLKTIKLGGLTNLCKAGEIANTLGLSINFAMMMESSLATAAAVHAACVLPNIEWGLSLGNSWIREEPVSNPIIIDNGSVYLSGQPGLGVQVDLDQIKRFADDS